MLGRGCGQLSLALGLLGIHGAWLQFLAANSHPQMPLKKGDAETPWLRNLGSRITSCDRNQQALETSRHRSARCMGWAPSREASPPVPVGPPGTSSPQHLCFSESLSPTAGPRRAWGPTGSPAGHQSASGTKPRSPGSHCTSRPRPDCGLCSVQWTRRSGRTNPEISMPRGGRCLEQGCRAAFASRTHTPIVTMPMAGLQHPTAQLYRDTKLLKIPGTLEVLKFYVV